MRWVLARLVAVGGDAEGLAFALAVLGADATLADAATLAGLATESAAIAADALIAANILGPERPYDFVHPLVRGAVYDGLSPARRAAAHRHAAHLVDRRGAPLARVAAHLLGSDPERDPSVVETLRAAAREATASGAPASAASYLQRAVAESPPRETRADLLVELGQTQTQAGLPGAIQSMRAGRDLQDDPGRRAEVFADGRPHVVCDREAAGDAGSAPSGIGRAARWEH